MNFSPTEFNSLTAPPEAEINIRSNILYSEEYSYLTRDELEVLLLLATIDMYSEGYTSFSFTGIKRKLDKHQQKIAKAIDRLISKNLILKTNSGYYTISTKGTDILSSIMKVQNAIDLYKPTEDYFERKITFDSKVGLDELCSKLVGKWFGPFRYLSHSLGKNLIIRWQLVQSKTLATMLISPNDAILSIYPTKDELTTISIEEAMTELMNYLIDYLDKYAIKTKINYTEWKINHGQKVDYQEKLSSWLGTYKDIAEN
ncbi:MAG: hypothetical protein U9O98_04410 [Asgard group archaeon]|nr:hypothetical protein [Asgard group archaeon]